MEKLISEFKNRIENDKYSYLNSDTWMYELGKITRSPEFIQRWKELVSYNFHKIDQLVKDHLPENQSCAFWTIAGGAVANVIWSIVYDKPLVLNDVDVFVWTRGPLKESRDPYFKTEKITFLKTEQINKFNIIYQHYPDLEITGPYARADLLGNRHGAYTRLLDSFDFNACMCLFDPYEEKGFTFARPFMQFLKEKKLKIYNFHHPLSTIIRGIKKEKEMQVQFDKHKVVEIFANLFSSINLDETRLGEKKKEEFFKHASVFEPWFSLDSSRKILTSKISNAQQQKYTNHTKIDVFSFFRLKQTQRDKLIFLINEGFFPVSNLRELMRNERIVIPDFNEEQAKRLAPFVKSHRNFQVNPLHIDKWLTFLKKMKKRNNLEFIGFAENKIRNERYKRGSKYYKDYPVPDFKTLEREWEAEVIKEAAKNNEILTVPLEIPENFKGKVIELVTPGQLKKEGLEMGHCVGGYSQQVKNGACRIFKIRLGEEKATLELKSILKLTQEEDAEFSYSIRQLRGTRNQDPHQDIVDLVDNFIKDMNNASKSEK